MFGIFETRGEITKKNGRLCSIEDAIEIAEEMASECPAPNLLKSFETIEEARAELKNHTCEIRHAQFWALGCGYNVYMNQILEYTINEDGELEPGDGWDFAKWKTPDICDDDEED